MQPLILRSSIDLTTEDIREFNRLLLDNMKTVIQ